MGIIWKPPLAMINALIRAGRVDEARALAEGWKARAGRHAAAQDARLPVVVVLVVVAIAVACLAVLLLAAEAAAFNASARIVRRAPAGPTTTSSSTTSSTSTSSSTTSTEAGGTTTTSSSSTTTSTSSTTSTTSADSNQAFAWVPHPPTNDNVESYPATSNDMKCMGWVPRLNMSLTRLAWAMDTVGVSATNGVAIYNADGSTRLWTNGGQTVSAAGMQTASVSLSVTGGTLYQVCYCSSSGSTSNDYVGPEWSVSSNRTQQVLGAGVISQAANDCSTGVPASTTGALSASNRPMFILLSVE